MRELIRIPIVHTAVELGSLSDSVKRLHVQRGGRRAWEQHVQAIDELWSRFRQEVNALELDCSRVRLYQDALPCCGRELEIVRELAGRGSPNHQFLLDLVGRGAQLMGTEDPQLLIQEYEQMRRALQSAEAGSRPRKHRRSAFQGRPNVEKEQTALEGRFTVPWETKGSGGSEQSRSGPAAPAGEPGRTDTASDQTLAARDRFIAGRICSTLQDGELGLLFLGAAHRVEHLLDPDIQVRVLRGCLPG